uniref:Uncharacterized LOC100177822 n=1 Tax=Ciona intestinalis TaxID=7719 RepID=F6YU40_CIOIN|nr:uncharacterized protein LOC100177822 [Ciona intestinalis]XP_026693549.1 uncharacterized protein LOC100177822 [Ciona intestinalis]|eukprot:XP_026693548.1 uncharacterized protein LOC100177822 [Ciona intestinalis]
MTSMKISVLLLGYICATVAATSVSSLGASNCTRIPRKSRVVKYVDWPFTLNCNDVTSRDWLTAYNISLSPDAALTCYIRHPDQHYYSTETSITLNGSSSILTTYTVTQRYSTYCVSLEVEIELRPLPHHTCGEDVITALRGTSNIIFVESEISGKPLIFECEPAANAAADAVLPPAVQSSQITTKWIRTPVRKLSGSTSALQVAQPNQTCSDLPVYYLTNLKVRLLERHNKPKALEITGQDFYDPAVYTCMVQYGGQTAYISHAALCIKQKVSNNKKPNIMCTGSRNFFQDDSLTVSCTVTTKLGELKPDELEITWTKGTSTFCTKSDLLSSTAPSSGGHNSQCGLEDFTNTKKICFWRQPASNEVQPSSNTFKAYLTFNKMKVSDAGTYHVSVLYKGIPSDPATFTLVFDRTRMLVKMAAGLTVCLVVMVSLIVLWLVYRRYRFRIKLRWRRHFGKYQDDDKKNIVVLSYYYDCDLADETRKATETIITCIKQQLNSMQYKYYDSHEDLQAGGFSVSSLLQRLDDSHRMIIILTEEYIRDRWSKFEAEQGLINMENNRTKLIFVRVKGVKKALQGVEDFPSGLSDALKTARNIRWKPGMNSNLFKESVAYALPNLKRSPTPTTNNPSVNYVKLASCDESLASPVNGCASCV